MNPKNKKQIKMKISHGILKRKLGNENTMVKSMLSQI
jgi:hypothetical protein